VTHRSVAPHDFNACKCRWPLSEPRTEAGQQLLADVRDEEGDYLAPWQVRGMILAIEREAGSASPELSEYRDLLDTIQRALDRDGKHEWDETARLAGIVADAVWNTHRVATPEPLPPCPICGKDDLFVGTDGKPGCPHCEVAVVLPTERLRAEPFDEAQAWADMAARRGDPELGTPTAEHGEWPGESRPINKARERQVLGIGQTPAPALDPWTTLRVILREAEAEGSWQFVRARCHEALARLRSRSDR
jgi:hypothetical protein